MICIENTNSGRRIYASRRMLANLGPNWREVAPREKITPSEPEKETPLVEEEVQKEVEKKDMVAYLKEKGFKGAHLMKEENLKKKYYENKEQEDGSD